MALPQIKQSLYDHTLYGAKKKIRYRGFTAAEQKILLMAKEVAQNTTEAKHGASDEVINAVSQIINNCTLGKVDPDELCTFDMEELFVRIRSKSVGEIMNVRYREDYKDEEGKPKSHFIEVVINLDDVKMKDIEGHESKFMVDENVGIQMRYPTFKILRSVKTSEELAVECIDCLFDQEQIYDRSTTSKAELEQFYSSLDMPALIKIQKFFETMPKLYYETKVTLYDGQKEMLKFEGLQSFFS